MPSNLIRTNQNRHLLSKLTTLVLSGTLASCASTSSQTPTIEEPKLIVPSEYTEPAVTYQEPKVKEPEDATPQRDFPLYFELNPAPRIFLWPQLKSLNYIGRSVGV
jgi:hypothetical protein